MQVLKLWPSHRVKLESFGGWCQKGNLCNKFWGDKGYGTV